MAPDDGAVDHLQGVDIAAAISQGLQQHISQARRDPAPMRPVDGVPVAQLVAPWDARMRHPEDSIQNPAGTAGGRPQKRPVSITMSPKKPHSSFVNKPRSTSASTSETASDHLRQPT